MIVPEIEPVVSAEAGPGEPMITNAAMTAELRIRKAAVRRKSCMIPPVTVGPALEQRRFGDETI
ncbi:MAG: hypothetical protein M3N49_09850, partial [Candidatus Eremiobacteraeota bacterium]|nr:hypothetical protein [Candidatus Eremiobacteraeota bacterium]